MNVEQINIEDVFVELNDDKKKYMDHLICIDGNYLLNPLCKEEELTEEEIKILNEQKERKEKCL